MSKLFKLKKWLSLSETAKRLTQSFDEEVTTTDVIQLAIDGHLLLSIRLLTDVHAFRWYKKHKSEIEYEEADSHLYKITKYRTKPLLVPVGGQVEYFPEFCEEDERFQLGTCAISFARDMPSREIVNLPLNCFTRKFLLQYFDILSGRAEYSPYDTGMITIQEENGDLWHIGSYDDDLLNDIQIVARTQSLLNLERSLDPQPIAKHDEIINPRRENTLMRIIGALVETIEDKTDYKNQTHLIDFLTSEYHQGNNGLSKSSLDRIIPDAKKVLKQSE